MKLKNIIISAITGTLLATLGSSAMAQNYPRRPVEMVIPFGTGGASDIFARQYAQIATKYLGKPLIAVNKGGAGTIEGMTYAYGAPADGYTIMEITPSLLIVEAQNRSSIKFRSEFEPILKVQADVVLFGVAAKSNYKTIDELVAFAKANPKKLKIGGLSPGGLMITSPTALPGLLVSNGLTFPTNQVPN